MTSPTPLVRIAKVLLASPDPQASAAFVRRSMAAVADPTHGSSGRLVFADRSPAPAVTGSSPGERALSPFWKISVFADDVDRTRSAITAAGVEVTSPRQFMDIGYLCHLNEPGGTEIELLQRTFRPARTDPPAVAGPGDDRLGLISLRVTDREYYERLLGPSLGMNLLATMAVDHGGPDPFDLSFWGFVDVAERPDPNPASIDNREWLYQLPVTMIELQHHRTTVELAGPSPLIEIRLEVGRVDQLDALADRLIAADIAVTDGPEGGLGFSSIDGHRFSVTPGEASQ